MADVTITPESKNSLAIANESKGNQTQTWNEATYSWDNAAGTWDVVRTVMIKESKNSLVITNENKN